MVARAKVFGVAGFERQFAVKRFSPELTVGAVASALSAAARSYGSLEHPRIARMSEFGVAQGQTFTAVEYVAGLDAFRLLQEAKLAGIALAAGGALALVSQAARAVGYAHGRGLSHLGLCPTNVIVTVDGDVKVTDFGILAATMPPRPVEAQRLAQRIAYLAPEQLAAEATSAATDVFVLGVIAYELVTGQRAYRGETPAQISHAILSGPPAEPPLPRPIVRVLQRCLARSPFERFPDARALADALDAALRVAPVPGTRKDIGAQIKTTLDRYAALNEGNLSGMVAMNLQTAAVADQGRLDAHDVSTQQFVRDNARTEPSPVVPRFTDTDVSPVVPSAASTINERIPDKPFSTMPGIAPPIPVPPGAAPPPGSPHNMGPPGAKTMLGLTPVKKGAVPGVIPPIAKPNGPAGQPAKPPIPTRRTPPPMPAVQAPDDIVEPSGLIEVEDSRVTNLEPVAPSPPSALDQLFQPPPEDSGQMPADDPSTLQGMGSSPPGTLTPAAMARMPKPTPGHNFDSRTGEMSPLMLDELNKRAVKNTAELQSLEPASISSTGPAALEDAVDSFAQDAGHVAHDIPVQSPSISAPRAPQAVQVTAQTRAPKKSPLPIVVLGLVLLAGLGAAGWYLFGKQDETKVAANDKGSAIAKTPADAAIAKSTADAAVIAMTTTDAKVEQAAPADAAVVASATPDAAADKAEVTPTKPTGSSDKLEIKSKPSGARVFIDGADQGTTPLKLPGSADRHTMVVLMPGHDLYIGEVDGNGVFDIELKAVTPTGGHAGIKLLKCKKDRYYVYVDGKPTGQTCPTERIDTVIGDHVVEVYDIVTDSRRKWDIFVKDERLSYRVRIEE